MILGTYYTDLPEKGSKNSKSLDIRMRFSLNERCPETTST